MALKQVRIGSLPDVIQYDDGDYDKAIETTEPIAVGTPVDVGDALRLGDEGDGGLVDGDKLDIDWNPSNYTPDSTIAEADDVDDLSAHLKGIDDALGNKLGDGTWTEYFGTSTVTGWSAYTRSSIRYKKVGTTVFVEVDIVGTSDSVDTTITLPDAAVNVANYRVQNTLKIADNGSAAVGMAIILQNSDTVTFYPSVAEIASNWANSGTKAINGQFFYEVSA